MKRSTKLQPSSTDKGAMKETTVNSKDLSGEEGKQWRKRRKRWEKPPKIEIVFVDPIPEHNLEIIKEIIKKAILRKQTILKKRIQHPKSKSHRLLRLINLSNMLYTKPSYGRNYWKTEHLNQKVILPKKKA